jgi:hypothetical protein
MKIQSIAIASMAILALPVWAFPATAQRSVVIQQILNTRSCQNCVLNNVDLRGLDLSNVDFTGANLSSANLEGANLTNANLSRANLFLTQLSKANLSGANLKGANLTGAKLDQVNLTRALLVEAALSHASLNHADLTAADLSRANLSDTDLRNARLANVTLAGTRFNYTNLTGAQLDPDRLAEAQLSNTDLTVISPLTDVKTEPTPSANLDPVTPQDAPPSEDTNTNAAAPSLRSEVDSEPSPVTEPQLDSKEGPEAESSSPQRDFKATDTPLLTRPGQQATAQHLRQGEVLFNVFSRFFSLPGTEVSATGAGGNESAAFFNFQGIVGITDSTELIVAFQTVDSGSPNDIGPEGIDLVRGDDTLDLTLGVKQRFWKNADHTLALSGLVSLAIPLAGERTFDFSNSVSTENPNVVPAVQLPFTVSDADHRWQFTIAPTIAFFQDDSAVFLPAFPVDDPGTFGTTFGFTGSAAFNIHPRLTLWGDAFIPVTGNNSLNEETGQTAKAIAFNAGIRYLVNPRLGLDLFGTNTFGSVSPLSLTADRTSLAFGAGLTFLPAFTASNRRYPNDYNPEFDGKDSPNTIDGLGFLDGGTVPNNSFLFNLQGGSQGILAALRYGLAKDLELFGYVDYISSDVDESEQGFGLKLRLLNQEEGSLFTGSVAVSVGLTNEPFLNFFNNDRTAFRDSGLSRNVPSVVNGDEGDQGELFVVTASLPLHYKVNDHANVWLTPTLAFVQQAGLELGGFNVGGSFEVIPDLSLVGEIGANFFGEGNTFIGNSLADRIPWNFAIRWDPSRLLGGGSGPKGNNPKVELFITNRVGSTPWHQFRVRDQNDVAVGAGISIPFSF